MTWPPPDWHRPGLKKKSRKKIEGKYRPTSVWILNFTWISLIFLVMYLIFIALQGSIMRPADALSGKDAAGLDWLTVIFTNGVSFLASLLLVPLLGLLGLMVYALVNLRPGRVGSRVIINFIAGMLQECCLLSVSC